MDCLQKVHALNVFFMLDADYQDHNEGVYFNQDDQGPYDCINDDTDLIEYHILVILLLSLLLIRVRMMSQLG